jgi:hypothetical protein
MDISKYVNQRWCTSETNIQYATMPAAISQQTSSSQRYELQINSDPTEFLSENLLLHLATRVIIELAIFLKRQVDILHL